jgi:hypothetical protein
MRECFRGKSPQHTYTAVTTRATLSHRGPVPPAPWPLEASAQAFAELLTNRTQRAGFRRSLEGLLWPTERTNTLTDLAHPEPGRGAPHATAHHCQGFCTALTWAPEALKPRRRAVLGPPPATALPAGGGLSSEETGARPWGPTTAPVGWQAWGALETSDHGLGAVRSLGADARGASP